jgi:hypothetical protein
VTTKKQRDELARIAKRFHDKMAAQGMEVTGAGPNDEGIPSISVYIHGRDCASRRGSGCDCRKAEEPS